MEYCAIIYKQTGWLTNYCTATPPALASFGIRARRKCLGACFGCLLPVKAREGRVNRSVSMPAITVN